MADNNSMIFPTLGDMLQGVNTPVEKKVIESVSFATPLVEKMAQKVIQGTSFYQKVRTSIPVIGAVPYNSGTPVSRGAYEMQKAECFNYAGMVHVHKHLVEAEPEAYSQLMHDEMLGATKGVFMNLERSIIYGKAVSPFGISGLCDLMGDYLTMSATGDHSKRVHGGASIWVLCTGMEMMRLVWGRGKAISFGPQMTTLMPFPTANGEPGMMPAYAKEVNFRVGFDMANTNSAVHMVNESAEHGVTDKMLQQMIRELPSGYTPTCVVMGRRSLGRLQDWRGDKLTYTNIMNATHAALPKTNIDGLPILCSDALLEDETEANIKALAKVSEFTMKKNMSNLKR